MSTHDQKDLLNLWFDFNKLIRCQTKANKKFDITSLVQMKALHYIGEQGRPAMSDIADYFGIARPSATSIVERLAKAKLLAREVDKDDRRAVRIVLTPQGKKELQVSLKEMKHNIDTIVSVLSKEEQHQFTKLLEKIITHNE